MLAPGQEPKLKPEPEPGPEPEKEAEAGTEKESTPQPEPEPEPKPEPERPLDEALSARMIKQIFGPTLSGTVYHALFKAPDMEVSGPEALEDALSSTFEDIYLQLEVEEAAARLDECTEVLVALVEQVRTGVWHLKHVVFSRQTQEPNRIMFCAELYCAVGDGG